jgi:plastocyanin
MNRKLNRLSQLIRVASALGLALAMLALLCARVRAADTWRLKAGAQSGNKAHQAFAFLPSEIWIHAGDSITWTFASDDLHTVTFLRPGQVRPAFQLGCPGTTPDGSPETGTTCVNSGVLVNGNTYTVTFPTTGNFKLVCLVHSMMTATVHVLDPSEALPHDQAFYDQQANRELSALLSDLMASAHTMSNTNGVSAGSGKVTATGGGVETASVMRFMDERKVIHVGETVEWTNPEAATNHTITFGPEPVNLVPPSGNVFLDSDGARHAIINSPSDVVHSGFISAAPQDRIGLPQPPLAVTRFRVTFTRPGVYDYICSLHDDVGMVGQIVVLP